MVRLKKSQEAFTVVDGPDAGKTFRPGMEYDQAPAGYDKRFENADPEPKESDKKRSKQ